MKNVMKFDLHVHTMLSKSIPFHMGDLNLMIAQARHAGLSGFALSEHIHAPCYWETYQRLRREFTYRNGIYHVSHDFYLFNGAEVNLSTLGHVVVLGAIEAIEALDRKLDLNAGNRPTLAQLLEEAADDLLLIGAHPFRPDGGLMKSSPSLIRRLTALEINGKDFMLENKVRQAARKLQMPVVGGSDAHLWPQLGVSSTEMPLFDVSIADLKHCIRSGYARARIDQANTFVVDMCSRHKRRVKELNQSPLPQRKMKEAWALAALTGNSAIQLSLV